MYLISAEGYTNAGVHVLRIVKTREILVGVKNEHNGLGVRNMSDPMLKEIYGRYGTKDLQMNKKKKYKMAEKDIFEKYTNLSEDELSEKSNKNLYVKNDVMITVIKRCRGEKKRRKKNR